MACAVLTQDINLDCEGSLGGVKEMYVIEFNNVASVTEASGVVTAITKVSDKKFRKYELQPNTANELETLAKNLENGTSFWNQAISIIINRQTAAVRNELMQIVKGRFMAVVVLNEGLAKLFGWKSGLDTTGATAGSGVQKADRNGYTLELAGSEKDPAPTVSTGILAGLTDEGV